MARQATAAEVTDEVQRLRDAVDVPASTVEGWLDPTLRIRPRESIPQDCARELRRDQEGFELYGSQAWRNDVGLRSGIVYARDLWEQDGALLAEYRGWEVWRYAPPVGDPEGVPVLTRVERER